MEIVKVNTEVVGGLSKAYLTLFNGTLQLTNKELDLLALLLDKYLEFREQGLTEPFLSKFVFSTEVKKSIQLDLKINASYFQNIIASISKKGVLQAQGAGQYTFIPHIIPRKEIGFRFG